MTKQQAAELLDNYQRWRKGEVDYFPVSPKSLSAAIDLAITNLGSALAETVEAKSYCEKHMHKEHVLQLEQYGIDVAGWEDYMYAMMADFANSKL